MTINFKPVSDSVAKRLSALEAARAYIVEDDEVQGGATTFRATRILVRPIVAALQRGVPAEELIEDYGLSQEQIAAARVYADARRSGAVHRFQFRAEIAARCEFWSTNLSPTLVELARERGYEAMAVRDLGLLNAKDWTLLEKIQNEDCTLVTNNVDEFRKRYARKAVLHAGAIFLVDLDPGQDVQRLAFAAALDEIDADADLVNLELLVEPEGSGFRARRLRLRRNNK